MPIKAHIGLSIDGLVTSVDGLPDWKDPWPWGERPIRSADAPAVA